MLKVLQTKPLGKVVDNRVWNITINSISWTARRVGRGSHWPRRIRPMRPCKGRTARGAGLCRCSFDTRLGLVMVQKLAWTPGTKAEYDSFGYGMLKLIITRVSGQSYVDYLRHQLCQPYGVPELKWIRHGARQKGEPRQLWNGLTGGRSRRAAYASCWVCAPSALLLARESPPVQEARMPSGAAVSNT